MMKEILKGKSPSSAFRDLIETDAALGNIRLGELLVDAFPNISGEALQLVWHWKGPGKAQGLSDSDLDALLIGLLKEAGYL